MSTRNYPELHEWLKNPRNKAYWDNDKVEVRSSKLGGLGVFAKTNITPVEDDPESGLLLRISKDAILSGPNSYISNLLYDAHIDGIFALILAFLYEKAQVKNSPWYDYIHSINFHVGSTKDDKRLMLPAALWPDEDRILLQGTDAELMGIIDPQDIEEDYSICLQFAKDNANIVKPPYELTPDENGDKAENERKYRFFAAACFAVSSRAFVIDDFHQLALVPAADLFNHDARGKEDVHFVAIAHVCPFCGRCDECGHDEYGPPDSEAEEYEVVNNDDNKDGKDDEGDDKMDDGKSDDDDNDDEKMEDDDDDQHDIDSLYIEKLDKKFKNEMRKKNKERLEDKEEDESFDVPDGYNLDEILLDPDQCCDIVLQKKVKKGDELLNTYGDLSNAILISKYGFTVKSNPNDTVCLGRQIVELRDGTDGEIVKRLDWWSQTGFSLLKEYKKEKFDMQEDESAEEPDDENSVTADDDSWLLAISIAYPRDLSLDALCLGKLLAASDVEFQKLSASNNKQAFETFVGEKIDSKGKAFLSGICQKRLSSLEGLKSPVYSQFVKGQLHDWRKHMICNILKDEKSILEKTIKHLSA